MNRSARSILATMLVIGLTTVGCTATDPGSGGVATEGPTVSTAGEAEEPIVSTGADAVYDLIRTDDPNALACLADRGRAPGEFYDKGIDDLVMPAETWFFEAAYTDGAVVEIRVHPDLGPEADARAHAQQIADAMGRLPAELRVGIDRVGLLGGDFGAQGDGGGEGIHLYAENMAVRQATNRLEETIFHESVHTSLDDLYAAAPEWLAAQPAAGRFLTTYGRDNPDSEDLAETTLYAYALLYHPDRIAATDAALWRARISNRIGFVESILPKAANQPPTRGAACS